MAPVPWNLSCGLLKITRRYKSDVRATSDDECVLCRLRSPPAPRRSSAGRVTLPSSSCHLWAAAWWGSVSQLSLLPARSLKPAAGCYTQGETAWTEIKWNLILWLCANSSTEPLFILLPASMFCSQVSRQQDVACRRVVVDVQSITGHTLPTTLWQFH